MKTSLTGQAMWHVVPLRLDAATVQAVKAITHANPMFQDSDVYRMLIKQGIKEAEAGHISLTISPPAGGDREAASKAVQALADASNGPRKPKRTPL
jgi:hypothetical protein